MNPKLKLYHYWRSSSSWRVRFALSHLQLPYEAVAVDLLNGESESPEHLNRNPAGFVPVLEIQTDSAPPQFLTESLAILLWLQDESEKQGKPQRILPSDSILRSKAWALAEVINAGTQPLQNIPVMQKVSSDPAEQKLWNQHWIRKGLEVYDTLARATASDYSVGSSLTVADLCLIPQLYNADRWGVDWTDLTGLQRIQKTCSQTSAYLESHPDRFQP